MTNNEEARQVEIAAQLEAAARSLAHSTRAVPNPADSYRMLGELGPTVDALAQVCRQLFAWHDQVVDGREYAGEDERGDGATGTIEAAARLEAAANVLEEAAGELRAAHALNGVVRWIGD